jgi:hypothetical protein
MASMRSQSRSWWRICSKIATSSSPIRITGLSRCPLTTFGTVADGEGAAAVGGDGDKLRACTGARGVAGTVEAAIDIAEGVCTGEGDSALGTDSATFGSADTPDAAVGTTGAEATGDSCEAASADLRTGALAGVDAGEATGATFKLGDVGEDAAEAARSGEESFELVGDGAEVAAVPVFTCAAGLSDTGDTRGTGLLVVVDDC